MTTQEMIDKLRGCEFKCASCACNAPTLDPRGSGRCERNKIAADMLEDLQSSYDILMSAGHIAAQTNAELIRRLDWWEQNALPVKPVPWAHRGRHEA